jgi:hypothetical protein
MKKQLSRKQRKVKGRGKEERPFGRVGLLVVDGRRQVASEFLGEEEGERLIVGNEGGIGNESFVGETKLEGLHELVKLWAREMLQFLANGQRDERERERKKNGKKKKDTLASEAVKVESFQHVHHEPKNQAAG